MRAATLVSVLKHTYGQNLEWDIPLTVVGEGFAIFARLLVGGLPAIRITECILGAQHFDHRLGIPLEAHMRASLSSLHQRVPPKVWPCSPALPFRRSHPLGV